MVFLVVHNESANPTSYPRFQNNIHKGGQWKKKLGWTLVGPTIVGL